MNAVIVSAVRTAIGSFGGTLKDVSAVELGKLVIKSTLERTGVAADQVDEVIFGNVLQAGLGQNIARQAALEAGLPAQAPAMTVNKVCGSGLRTVALAAQTIATGYNDVVIAGGTENMSAAPYILNSNRWGQRMGDSTVVDVMINDALTCATNSYHMGVTAENIASRFGITREEQDEFALKSQQKAAKAQQEGKFKKEIVPVVVPQRRGQPLIFQDDEYIKADTNLETLGKLRPAFKKAEGTVTAGNASGINDGAAALLIMSEEKAKELNLEPMARIVSFASAGVDPAIMGSGPVPATKRALEMAGLKIEDLDLIEANEAFAAQALYVGRELGLDPDKTNVNGGAIALGHPVGCSGARILVTLVHEMVKRGSRYGLATLCIGGGQGTAMIVENIK